MRDPDTIAIPYINLPSSFHFFIFYSIENRVDIVYLPPFASVKMKKSKSNGVYDAMDLGFGGERRSVILKTSASITISQSYIYI